MKTYTIQDFLEVKSASGGSFSPDGTQIAFVSNQTGTSQLYLTSIQGGDAKQITSYEDPLSFAVFSPTKNEILFGKAKGGDENTQLYLYSVETSEIKALTEQPQVRHDFGKFPSDGRYISYSSTERNGKDRDVYIMNLETGEKECVYDKGGSCHVMRFSPKGTYLVIKRSNTNLDQDVFLLNLQTRAIEHINPHEGAMYVSSIYWLPDESLMYMITNTERDFMGLGAYT